MKKIFRGKFLFGSIIVLLLMLYGCGNKVDIKVETPVDVNVDTDVKVDTDIEADIKENVDVDIKVDTDVKVDADTNVVVIPEEENENESKDTIEDAIIDSDIPANEISDPAIMVEAAEENEAEVVEEKSEYKDYYFKNKYRLDEHYEKHGIEMGFASAKEYEKAASDVINNPAALTKLEAEDGDYVYYVEESNEFVILSPDGFIRTYFNPSAGKAYFDRQ